MKTALTRNLLAVIAVVAVALAIALGTADASHVTDTISTSFVTRDPSPSANLDANVSNLAVTTSGTADAMWNLAIIYHFRWNTNLTGTWVSDGVYGTHGYCEHCQFLQMPKNDDFAWPSWHGFICFTTWSAHNYDAHLGGSTPDISEYRIAAPKCY
jgi:hypothetical protein